MRNTFSSIICLSTSLTTNKQSNTKQTLTTIKARKEEERKKEEQTREHDEPKKTIHSLHHLV